MLILLVSGLCLGLIVLSFLWVGDKNGFHVNVRPSSTESLYDYAGILEHNRESTERYLSIFREDYKIDAVVVTLEDRGQYPAISDLAPKLLSGWQIGKDHHGRGLLLLLIDDTKEVKLEVSYELEDVFTDLFTGYIEDRQLRPYFLSGGLAEGIVAVMEEIEQRAELKHQKDYTPALIAQLDRELLSGGGGAKRVLTEYERELTAELPWTSSNLPGGKTPEEAFQIMLSKGLGKEPHPDRDIYTDSTKLATNDDQNNPDPRIRSQMRHWASAKYEVISNNNYAVIFFGKRDGWQNAPILFARTSHGWKFDIVSQRKWITMGRAPKWGIQRANHPYVGLLHRAPYWMDKDIWLEPEDRYQVRRDRQIVARIIELEKKYKSNAAKVFALVLELGRLGAITSRRPQYVYPYLKKALQLNPDSPLPHKYLAIYQVESTFQYQTALRSMKKYAALLPEDIFGNNFLGYLYFQLKEYEQAIGKFEQVINIDPQNSYAYCKMSRAYALLYLQSNSLNPLRSTYKSRALEMYAKATEAKSPDSRRIQWLKRWLKKKGIAPAPAGG